MAAAATVTTDHLDYPPGSTVIITGTGFAAGETVQLHVLNLTDPSDSGAEHDLWTTNADENGQFTTTWFVTDDELGMTLQLTATGVTSGEVAQAIFTDGSASDGTGNLALTPTQLNSGTTNTLTFTFSTDSGKDYLTNSLATIVIPAGWTPPQTNSSSAQGYLYVRSNFVAGGAPFPYANITNISGTGPWTIYIDFSAQKNGNGFIFVYSNTVSPSGTSTNSFTVSTRNNTSSAGVLTPLVAGAPSYSVVVGPPNHLGFTTTAQTLVAGVNSSTITVQIQDAGNNPTNAASARLVNLSTTSAGGIFRNAANTTTITAITIAAGQTSTNLLYNDTVAGNPTITAASSSPTSIGSATQQETINPAPASQLVFISNPVTNAAGATSTAITVQRRDPYGNPNSSDATVTVNLTGSSAGGSFLSTNGTTTFTSTNILTGSSTASYLYKDSLAGQPVITNAASGLSSAIQTESITKATPAISGVTASQSISYGTATVNLSGTVSAVGPVYPANGETISVTINSLTTNAVIAGGAGGFAVNFAAAAIPYAAGAYTITYAYAGDANLNAAANNTSTTLTVNKAVLGITAANTNRTYGATNPPFTFSAGGFVNGETSGVLSGSPSLTTTATTNSPVGSYPITASAGTLSAANYVFNFTNGTLAVNPAPLGITASNQSKTFGTVLTLGAGQTTFNPSGLLNNETIGSVTLAASGGTASNAAPGTYTITPSAATGGTFTPANYAITYTNGTLTVNQAGTAIAVASSQNPSGYRASISFTATLPAGASGSVTFLTNGVALCTSNLVSGLATSLTLTNLSRGTNVITAQYAGDANYSGSTNVLSGGQIVTNHAPVAGDVTYTRNLSSLKIFKTDLLTNACSDVDGDTLTITTTGTSTNGVSLASNPVFLGYINNNKVNDQFTYTVSDGFGGTATGTIRINFTPFVTAQNGTINSSNGMAHVAMRGIPGFLYEIQRSTNLVDWTTLANTNTPASGDLQFDDQFNDLGSVPASAYYRLKWNP